MNPCRFRPSCASRRATHTLQQTESPTAAEEDRTTKRTLYEQTFRMYEYFCYDPEAERLEGWRLGQRGRYRSIRPNERGWMHVEKLDLWLGTWRGPYQGFDALWLRFYDSEGSLVPLRSEAAEQQAAVAEQRATAAEQRAAAAEQWATAAEEEITRLNEKVARLERGGKPAAGAGE